MTRIAMILVLALAACDAKAPEKKADGDAKAGAKADAKPADGEAKKPAAKADAETKTPADAKAADAAGSEIDPKLLDPAAANETAPESYKVKFETTAGDFVVEVKRDQAPVGADRFYNLVKIGFYDDTAFFRAIKGFMVQFGLHGEPAVNKVWRAAQIDDDPVKGSNKRGMLTFAKQNRPNTRTTQVFINFSNNKNLDGMGFAPFGTVVEGMDVVDKIHTGYGEGAPRGRGPSQGRIQAEGNAYLKKDFPELDFIKKASIIEG
ncbi:MAG: peptidylprolyl isomerase [Nannocystaceae bacterium]|nr:peptidylprolyl isomerase [bacterium]